ncbi:MAG: RNA polymerase sigma factor, partial [Clostridia bacterium]|nr:RNA polymerase sigma factor [Clostridia bacterium]
MEEKRLDFGQTAGAFTVVPVKETVIEKAMDGDQKAFEAVFMGTYRYVYATARQYLKNDQDIYDAIQDTYLKVYKSLPRLQSASSFYPWLHRICENCAKDILAQAGPPTVSLDGEVEVVAADRTEAATVATDVAEVLKQLPPEQAELLVRVYYDKLRVAEIARLQGVPVTTVHNRLRAAKRRLRELLKIRGIDKPVYGGDLIALLSTAIRNAIGTELLSMAIAEEILHKVTGSHNRRGAAVVSHFARKQRSHAALRIASLLMTACALLTATGILVFNLVTGGFRQPETPTAAPPSTTVSTVTTTTTTTTTDLPVPAGHRVIISRRRPGGHVLAELQGQLQFPPGAGFSRHRIFLHPAQQMLSLGAAPAEKGLSRPCGILYQGVQQPAGGDDAVGRRQRRRLLNDGCPLNRQGGRPLPHSRPRFQLFFGQTGQASVLFVQGAQKQMLRADGPVAQPFRRLIGPHQRPLSALRKPLLHQLFTWGGVNRSSCWVDMDTRLSVGCISLFFCRSFFIKSPLLVACPKNNRLFPVLFREIPIEISIFSVRIVVDQLWRCFTYGIQ